MNAKPIKILLCLAAVAALALSVVLALHFAGLNRQIRQQEVLLDESRAAWEKTAAEKEALQDERKQLNSDLREAQLTLSESRERAQELQEENDTLRQEIASLEASLPAEADQTGP